MKKFNYNFYYIDEEKNNFFQINKFDPKLIRPEGSNCLATQKKHKDIMAYKTLGEKNELDLRLYVMFNGRNDSLLNYIKDIKLWHYK